MMLGAQDSLTHLPGSGDSSLILFFPSPCLVPDWRSLGVPISQGYATSHQRSPCIPAPGCPHSSRIRTIAPSAFILQDTAVPSCSPYAVSWICINRTKNIAGGFLWPLPAGLKQWASHWSPAAGTRPGTLFPPSGERGRGIHCV